MGQLRNDPSGASVLFDEDLASVSVALSKLNWCLDTLLIVLIVYYVPSCCLLFVNGLMV